MNLADFRTSYEELDICCLSTVFLDGDSSSQWSASSYEGKWVAGVTAGGSLNNIGTSTTLTLSWALPIYLKMEESFLLISWTFLPLPETFWMNPQYRFKVEVNRENSLPTDEITMLVSLMQKPDKRNRRLSKNLHIGFSVFEVNPTCWGWSH